MPMTQTHKPVEHRTLPAAVWFLLLYFAGIGSISLLALLLKTLLAGL